MPAGETHRRRNRAADRVHELLCRLDRRLRRGATIARAIWRRVALLAVVAQHARELSLVPLATSSRARELLRRGPSACRAARRRRRRSHARGCRPASTTPRGRSRRRRRSTPSSRAAERLGITGADEAQRAGHLACELTEALFGQRVAIDRDQRPSRPETLGDEPRVAAVAEGAVDDDVAGGRREQLEQLVRQHGDMRPGNIGAARRWDGAGLRAGGAQAPRCAVSSSSIGIRCYPGDAFEESTLLVVPGARGSKPRGGPSAETTTSFCTWA